jgi:hypothetical protein
VDLSDGIESSRELLQKVLNLLSAQCPVCSAEALCLKAQERAEHSEVIGDAMIRLNREVSRCGA